MKPFKKIAITSGDKNGIGFEVAAKALSQINPNLRRDGLFFLFRHSSQNQTQPRYFKLLDKTWKRLTFDSLEDSLAYLETTNTVPKNLLVDLSLDSSEAEWVVSAVTACKNKKLTTLVTGPLSKKLTSVLPEKVLGHTGIFRQIFPTNKLFMSFVGKNFNILLATDHQPLSTVENTLMTEGLGSVIEAAQKFRTLIKSKKKVAVLGFNPHSGENGLIGNAETFLFAKMPANFVGPLVPDAAFLKKNWGLYSVFICLYHDQGLIPFKMQHGQDSGVQLTVGLPFIRTSVDHGTAFDLFNKNVANANSMLEAIKLGIQLTGA